MDTQGGSTRILAEYQEIGGKITEEFLPQHNHGREDHFPKSERKNASPFKQKLSTSIPDVA
jgi:hypothetical protein